MKCEEARVAIVARVAGQLRGEEARALREHVQSCPTCTEEFSATMNLWKALEAWDDAVPPSRLSPPPLPRHPVLWPLRPWAWAVAAAAVVLVGLGIYLVARGRHPAGAPETPAAVATQQPSSALATLRLASGKMLPCRSGGEVAIPGGERARLDFAESQFMFLAGGTVLSLSNLSSESASVAVRVGVVDVHEEGPAPRLALAVPGGKVRGLGTQYRVRAVQPDRTHPAASGYAEVEVYAGRVRVEGLTPGQAEAKELQPGAVWACAQLKDRGRLEGEFLGTARGADLVGRPELHVRLRTRHLGEFLLAVPIEANDVAAQIEKLKAGERVAVNFVRGRDTLWLEGAERLEGGLGEELPSWLACEFSFSALSPAERERLLAGFGPGSNPATWREAAMELAADEQATTARAVALRLLVERLDQRQHARTALSSINLILARTRAGDVPELLFPAIYRVFFVHADHVLWQEAAESLTLLKDPLAGAPLRAAQKRFRDLAAFPTEMQVDSVLGGNVQYSREDRIAQQQAVLRAIARALAASEGSPAQGGDSAPRRKTT